MIRPQVDFPLMEKYKEKFAITDDTIFAYGDCIYTNNALPQDILIHEMCHLNQQATVGLDNWVEQFLNDPQARLRFELEAYRVQLHTIKDRNQRDRRRRESARNLSSALYGNIIDYDTAFKLLKV